MKKISHYVRWTVVMIAALSLTACSGNGENKKADEESTPLIAETGSEILQTESAEETEKWIETESETEYETETETEYAAWGEESSAEEMSEFTEEPAETYSVTMPAVEDTWSVPEVTVKDVPKDLLTAALMGNKAIYTYLGSEKINYEYYSTDYYKGYAFLMNPAQLLGYDAYGGVRYGSGFEDDPEMMFLIIPQDEKEYEETLGGLKKYLGKHSSNECTRTIAAPNGEETDSVYAAQEYMIDGNACYLIEGYRSNDIFFRFDRFGYEGTTRADQIRFQGECEKCLVLMSRAGLGFLSDYSTVYDLDRYMRYEDSDQDLSEELSEEGLYVYYGDSDFEIDDYPGYAYDSSDYCYYAYDSLDYDVIHSESQSELSSLVRRMENDTRNLIRMAGRLEQMDGYKGAYDCLLDIAAVLIRRGESDRASGIISYLETQWKNEDKTERRAAFWDASYNRLYHNEEYLNYLKEILADKDECRYLNTVWQVRISAAYQYGERDIKYGSSRYIREYQPLVDRLVELKEYRNAPLYLQNLLKPFLVQTIAERNTDAAEEIIAMMEAYFPECGSYEVTQTQLDRYHSEIDTIKEEETYKANKRAELNGAAEGDVITFGTRNGSDLEWIVLSRQEDKVQLLLKNSFGPGAFGEQQTKIKYMDSEVRRILEDEIYEEVFSNAEKQMVLPFTLKSDGTYRFEERGNHFHLPGTKEVKEYLPEKEDRILYLEDGTPQAWWLRAAGSRPGFVRYVDADGSIAKGGTPSVKELEVRPLVWIDCSEN